MARVELDLDDPLNAMTLKAMLEAEGHAVVRDNGDVIIASPCGHALARLGKVPVLVLASAAQIGEAVAAMREGVYGYVFLPFQPGEAGLMVRRANEVATEKSEPQPEVPETLENAEARHITAVLRACKNNQAEAARRLGIGRNTLWRKLRAMRAQEGENR